MIKSNSRTTVAFKSVGKTLGLPLADFYPVVGSVAIATYVFVKFFWE
jgi:hypothetical protein